MKFKLHTIALATFLLLIAAVPAPAGLIGHWVADDWSGTGNWTDRVSSLVAVPSGDPTVAAGAFNTLGSTNGIDLDGNDHFAVNAANNPATGNTEFTVIASFKTTTGGANNNTGGQWWQNSGIVGGEVSANPNDWGLMLLQDGRVNGAFRATSVQSTGSVIDGNVHTLAVTWSETGDTIGRVYLDGVLIGNTGVQDGGAGISNTGFAIGRGYEGGGAYYTGEVAVVQFYDSVEDIGALHNSLVPEPSTFLLTTFGLLGLRRRRKR